MFSVVFMGTPDFAVPALKALIDAPDMDVKLVITQPDKPQGRRHEVIPCPVKQVALQNNINVFQPATLKSDEAYETICGIAPDFMVVAAYGKILPQKILDIPRNGCINLHGSILPKYRGSAPIQWSVLNGDKITGVTSMLMNAGIDTGDILLVSSTPIYENETAGQLFDRLAALCPELLIKTLHGVADGTVKPQKQDEENATYVSVLTKEMSIINWRENAEKINNLVRGLNPWPVAKTVYENKQLKIFSGKACEEGISGECGAAYVMNGELYVICGGGTAYRIDELQLEGSRAMGASEFLRGHAAIDGCVLG